MMRSQNPHYEFWSATPGEDKIAVVIGHGNPHLTIGYLLPQRNGGWKISVEGVEYAAVYPNEHEAAEEIYRLYRRRAGQHLSN